MFDYNTAGPSLVSPFGAKKNSTSGGVGEKSSPLDPNHSHFVMVDNAQLNMFGGEIKFRGRLEKAIVSYRKDAVEAGESTRNESEAPIVVLVLEGGPNTLETG